MKYYVTLAVNARVEIEVEANSVKDAINKAETEFTEIDIGDLECVDATPHHAIDENGKWINC